MSGTWGLPNPEYTKLFPIHADNSEGGPSVSGSRLTAVTKTPTDTGTPGIWKMSSQVSIETESGFKQGP